MRQPALARMFPAAAALVIGVNLLGPAMDRPIVLVEGSPEPIVIQPLGGVDDARSIPTPVGRLPLSVEVRPLSVQKAAPTPGSPPTPVPARKATPTPGSPQTPAPTASPVPTPKPTPKQTPSPTPPASTGWVTVVNDTFASAAIPKHWSLYDAPYGSGPQNCAAPSHVVASGGVLHLLLSYEASGAGSANCGPGWYSGGLSLKGFSAVDQQVTVRFRVVRNGVGGHFIIPMRWPDDDSSWPGGGEEDYCETSDVGVCSVFLHYDPSNRQIAADYAVDLTQWHTIRTERLDHTVRIFIDDMTKPVWTYAGTAATMPDTLKHVLLQQECQSSCPNGTAGTEDIQVDWITVANPG